MITVSAPANSASLSLTRLRLRVYLPSDPAPALAQLTSTYGLGVRVSQIQPDQLDCLGQLDLELHGPIAQLQAGLSYLSSISLTIQGKPNADGDSWSY